MRIVRRLVCYGLATLLCLLAVGCQQMPNFSQFPMPEVPDVTKFRLLSPAELAHKLRGDQLHKLNRHTPPNRSMEW